MMMSSNRRRLCVSICILWPTADASQEGDEGALWRSRGRIEMKVMRLPGRISRSDSMRFEPPSSPHRRPLCPAPAPPDAVIVLNR